MLRRDFILGSAALLATERANPLITLERNKPRYAGEIPLWRLDERTRTHILRRRAWIDRREQLRERLYDAAVQAMPGALYRYLHFAWTHMHPYWEWPEFYAEQLERVRWAYDKIERAPMRPRGKYFVVDRAAELAMHRAGLLGQMIMVSGGRSANVGGGGGGGSPVMGAFAVDVDNLSGVASDSNDGIWDSDGPWATWSKANSELAAGTLGIGDWLYMREGDYVPTALTRWEGGGTTANASKITVAGWPGEQAVIDFSVNDDRTMLDGSTGTGPIILSSANYRLRDFRFISYSYGFATDNGVACHGSEFISLVHTRFGTATTSGNINTNIAIDDGSNNDQHLIEGCDLSDGNEVVGGNGSTVYVIHSTGTIRNNLIGATGSGSQVLHYKRQNSSTTLGNTTIENNIISRYGTGGRGIYFNNVQYGIVQHNCFSGPPGSGNPGMYGTEDGVHPQDGWSWYRCELMHNTSRADSAYTSATGYGLYHPDTPSGNIDGTETTFLNDVHDGTYTYCAGDTSLKTHTNVQDYSLYATDTTNLGREGNNNYSNLAAWQANTTLFGGSHDDNSVEEDIIWDLAFDRWNAAAYALDATSAGKGAADDMTDMGADTALVGPGAL